MTWTQRLPELASFTAPNVRWRDVWAVVARGERGRGRSWAQDLLWSLKYNAWITSLDEDRSTCRACGGKIEGAHALSRYCMTACRKVAYRRREKDEPTDWEAVVAEAADGLNAWRREVDLARRALRRWSQQGPALIMPPDFTHYDHLPLLPERCPGPCGGACEHTGGGICLYASTAIAFTDDLTEEQGI